MRQHPCFKNLGTPKFSQSVFPVALNEAGVFQWTDWADRFGAMLKQHGLVPRFEWGFRLFPRMDGRNVRRFSSGSKIALPGDLQHLKSCLAAGLFAVVDLHGQLVKIQRP